jgi:Uma2 family endonuclease
MSAKPVEYRITASQFERMGEAGVFKGNARLELLEGSIYDLPPISPLRARCETYLIGRFLAPVFSRRFNIQHQQPIRLDDFSEPQPDIALLRWRDDFYHHAIPTPDDVLLVIEVADPTVETDRSYKVPLYAKAGIAEVWLVNLPKEQIKLYASPANEAYQITQTFKRGEVAQSNTIEDLAIHVSDILEVIPKLVDK